MISDFFPDDVGEETCPGLSSCIRIVIGIEEMFVFFKRISKGKKLKRKHTSKFWNGHYLFLVAVVVDLTAIE
jgi:hypothetical protein